MYGVDIHPCCALYSGYILILPYRSSVCCVLRWGNQTRRPEATEPALPGNRPFLLLAVFTHRITVALDLNVSRHSGEIGDIGRHGWAVVVKIRLPANCVAVFGHKTGMFMLLLHLTVLRDAVGRLRKKIDPCFA